MDNVEFNRIREAVAMLRRMGIDIEAFSCTHETKAHLDSLGITAAQVLTGNIAWMSAGPQGAEMGRGVGSRYEVTLCGIPLRVKVPAYG